jgi:uncharacterized protein (TIGR03086 family)
VRDLVNHIVYENVWTPPLMEGQTIEQVGDRFEGDLLGDDPVVAWNKASAAALASVEADGALDRTVHLSYGDVPAGEYIEQLFNDHVIHAWDLARGIEADDELDPELVEVLYAGAQPREEQLRESGMFGDKVEVPDDADTQTKLLALMGRRA